MSSFRWFFILLLFLPTMASSSAKPTPFHIKVLSAESQNFQAPPLAPPNCNFEDLNAYCSSSRPETYVAKTMVVQDERRQVSHDRLYRIQPVVPLRCFAGESDL